MEVRHYVTDSGRDVVGEWIEGLNNRRATAKIGMRISRIAAGNFGDCRPVGQGVWELRIDWGPGYRVYHALAGKACVLLLCGGDKRKQSIDIARALAFWKDYQRRISYP